MDRWLIVISHRMTFRDELAEWCHVIGRWRTPAGQRVKHVPVAGYGLDPAASAQPSDGQVHCFHEAREGLILDIARMHLRDVSICDEFICAQLPSGAFDAERPGTEVEEGIRPTGGLHHN